MAADAPSLALWGYQLYGGRVLSPQAVSEMTTAPPNARVLDSFDYGLGTMLFSAYLGLGLAVGHEGRTMGYSTALAVVPERHLSVALLIAEENKAAVAVMQRLFAAIQGR